MAEGQKRYYWLKLQNDFFSRKEIKRLRRIAGGDTLTIIYLKMLCRSLKDNGKLYYDGLDNDFVSELAMDIDEDTENVQITVNYLIKTGLLEQIDEVEYTLKDAESNTGTETAVAARVRKHRERQKALQCNANVTAVKQLGNVEIEKEKDKEIDKDIEIDNNKKTISPSLAKNLKTSGIRINEKQHQQLLEYVGLDGMSFDMLNRAIEITSEVHQPSFKYLKAILEKWKESGFTSLEQVDEHEEERRSSKNSTSRRVGNSIIQTYDDPLPF